MKKGVIIFDFNRTLFDPEKSCLFDGVIDVLSHFCNQGFNLILLGKGDDARRAKVKSLNIEQYFSEIHIVEEKSSEQLENIVIKGKNPSIYSVGDRVKKEIKLGNEYGFITIWFRNGKFSKEIPQTKKEEPTYTISSLLELKCIIH